MLASFFYCFIISFILGVTFESIFSFGLYFALFIFILSIISFLILRRSGCYLVSYLVSFVIVVFLGFAFGVLRVDVSSYLGNVHSLDTYQQKQVVLKGIVLEEPDVRESYTNFVLKTESVLYENKENVLKNSGAYVLVRVPQYPVFHYGDEVIVKGKILPVKNFKPKEGEKSFDYKMYLTKDEIYYQMYFPSVTVIKNNQGNLIKEKLFELKNNMLQNIGRAIHEPEAALAGGITLGAKQSLGEELLEKFRETGLIHIVVLSGYNIAVVVVAIGIMTSFLPFVWRIIFSVIAIILFAVMVGGGATVVRATIMALIALFARVAGREGDALRALFLAGGIMVAFNPMIILHDVSFQLSFMATLSLILFSPILEKYFIAIKSKIFREIIIATLSTQIFVVPLLLYHMGSTSLVGVLANIFVLPIVPLAMFLVFLVALFSWVPALGVAMSFCAYAVLAYIIMIADSFSKIPFAFFSGVSFPLWALFTSYFLLTLYLHGKVKLK